MEMPGELLHFTSKEVSVRSITIHIALEMVVNTVKQVLETTEVMRCKVCELAQLVFYTWLWASQP
jgi:hypothetical protein